MKVLTARFGDDRNICTGHASILGLVVRNQHLDFGDGIHRDRHRGVEVVANGVDSCAVNRQVIRCATIALHVEVPIGGQLFRVVKIDNARQQRHQRSDGASAQREVLHLRCSEHASPFRGLRLNHRALLAHLNGIRHLSHFKPKIGDVQRLSRRDIDRRALQAPEARCFNEQVVRPGLNRAEEKTAGFV